MESIICFFLLLLPSAAVFVLFFYSLLMIVIRFNCVKCREREMEKKNPQKKLNLINIDETITTRFLFHL